VRTLPTDRALKRNSPSGQWFLRLAGATLVAGIPKRAATSGAIRTKSERGRNSARSRTAPSAASHVRFLRKRALGMALLLQCR
jgi:hypothetical protein